MGAVDDFDWSIYSQTTTAALVRGQLEYTWAELGDRLVGLTDDEMRWEPAPRSFAVVRRGEERWPRTVGGGEWVAEWPGVPDGHGTRTIGWLLAHMADVVAERCDSAFGDGTYDRESAEVAGGSAEEAVAALAQWVRRWRAGIAALDEEQVWQVGLSTATEVDAMSPFAHLVLHITRELIAHGAEVTALRDLYAARAATSPAR